jgi:hypothetical protein
MAVIATRSACFTTRSLQQMRATTSDDCSAVDAREPAMGVASTSLQSRPYKGFRCSEN